MSREVSNADILRMQDKVIDDYFWKYYENNDIPFGLCSLCGNSGVIDTRQTAISGAGVNAGRLNYCLCPNGRAMRESKMKLMDAKERDEWFKQYVAKMKAKQATELKSELEKFRKGEE